VYYARKQLSARDRRRTTKPYVHHNLVLVTSAPFPVVQARLAELACGAVRMWADYPQRVVYEHIGSVNGDSHDGCFTAVVTFQYLGPQALRAVTSIDSWRDDNGGVSRSEAAAVQSFMNSVVAAFQAIDPMVQVSR